MQSEISLHYLPILTIEKMWPSRWGVEDHLKGKGFDSPMLVTGHVKKWPARSEGCLVEILKQTGLQWLLIAAGNKLKFPNTRWG